MTSIGLIDDKINTMETILGHMDWRSLWQTVCDLDRVLSEEEPAVERRHLTEDRRETIAVETLNLALDLDDEWAIYRMKAWVQSIETQIREIFS